jgi:carbonic anhydrase/acetyltransferase-like protein (isoleucine patch superfamily)
MPIVAYLHHVPKVGADVSFADDAYLVGQVTLAGPAVLEASAVIRADREPVRIGPGFHMGRQSSIHIDGGSPTIIGAGVWLGSRVVVHGCTLGDGVRVEDGGLVLSGSNVGSGSIVAAGSLVTEGATFASNSYIEGTPGRRIRDTTAAERAVSDQPSAFSTRSEGAG